jgi:nucleoside-diphosphate-sugar epimerase
VRVLVTGASGFIGGTLCRALVARGDEVWALVRRPGSEPAGTTALVGDLSSQETIALALQQAAPDCVVHLAAEIASQRSAEKVFEVNVRGTERLVDACRRHAGNGGSGGPRIVFSSTVVTGDAHGELLVEARPLPVETPYGRAKQAGEQLVLSSGLPAVVLRPSHVYGPGGWYAQELIPRLRQPGRFAVIGSGANLWDVVHVDDVVGALLLCCDQEGAVGGTFNVADDQPLTFYEFMKLTADALGLGPPRRIPTVLARLVAGANAVDAVVRSARTSNAKIKADLGWQPRYPSARQGIPDAVARLPAGA